MQAALCSDRNKQIKEVENGCLEKINFKKKPEEYLLSSPYKKNTGPNVANLNSSDSDMTKDLVESESLCSDQNNGMNAIENIQGINSVSREINRVIIIISLLKQKGYRFYVKWY
ncbi:unnamed protein product [Diabrotica balteata]|uniref:Uncharacterized protein n=1 Tax=Diabrotica balteata TaxID=107213 RepID=A0A9N9TDY2_DIABA|nr:unnamed protein product [Diabrotica balteata]